MLAAMLGLVASQELAVLATAGPEGPRASLMSYLSDEGGRVLYLLTSAQSRKFANLSAEPRVSLLVDDRGNGPDDGVKALTVNGEAQVVEEPGAVRELKQRFAAQRPALAGLAADPACRVVMVRVRSLLLLEGPSQSAYEVLV